MSCFILTHEMQYNVNYFNFKRQYFKRIIPLSWHLTKSTSFSLLLRRNELVLGKAFTSKVISRVFIFFHSGNFENKSADDWVSQ